MSVRRESINVCNQRVCAKHPQKTASHQLVGKEMGGQCYYCEKCSIMLASQGYNVVKIVSIGAQSRATNLKGRSSRSSYQSYSILSNRKTEISSFVDGLQNLSTELNRKLQYIQQHLMKSETQYGRMIEETNKFYKQIEEAIQLQKYSTYNSILNKRSLEEGKIRQARQSLFLACDDIDAMLTDIRQNMDAVQTVDYSIYNTIMGGYQTKLDKLKSVAKQTVIIRPIQRFDIVLPQIPKALLTLSEKIQIGFKKSIHSTIQNSINNSSMHPRRIMTEDDEVVCQSQQLSPCEEPSSSHQDSEKDDTIRDERHERHKQNTLKAGMQNQLVAYKGSIKQLAFSFDQNSKQLKLSRDSNVFDASNLLTIQGFQEGKISKIQERLNSKEVCESRQSLGQYLNISNSRERHFNQDTQTLLIA